MLLPLPNENAHLDTITSNQKMSPGAANVNVHCIMWARVQMQHHHNLLQGSAANAPDVSTRCSPEVLFAAIYHGCLADEEWSAEGGWLAGYQSPQLVIGDLVCRGQKPAGSEAVRACNLSGGQALRRVSLSAAGRTGI